MSDNTLFQEYAILKNEIKRLEERLSELQPQLLESMKEDEMETEWGKFVKVVRRQWEFPEHIKEKQKEVKEEENRAKKLGEAEYKENVGVTFYAKKNESENS